jgi:hypothetical protein
MDKSLIVTQTRCRHGKPLVVVHNLPGEGAELRPDQLRALAKALTNAAIAADSGAADHGKQAFEHLLLT